ncbi:MAG: hypothetical protein A2Z27_03135 [candidate division Zixibacteria bacterium RBG_16_50_21]|nr:MAG: hypothetical protein A2Z27_03135 [candidate division Zixibacteria bacterium RBG_16_50_21]
MNQKKPKKYQKKRRRNNSKWIPILVALGGFLLIGVTFLAFRDKSGTAFGDTGTPNLKVDKEMIDLGDVKLNQPVQVSFQLTNAGDGMLRFTKDPYAEVVEGC